MRHFLNLFGPTPDELRHLLTEACRLKAAKARGVPSRSLAGKVVALIFEKPSTRTRVSFEVGVAELGGHPVVIDAATTQLGRGETIKDTARVLSRYCAAIVIRTFGQDRIERLASASTVPLVNALTDFAHPCQALADLLTIRERRGVLSGLTLTYLGDGNNVAHSLMFGGVKLGMDVRVGCPQGFEPFPSVVDRCRDIAAETRARLVITNVVAEAAVGADVLYTDVWASMGQEEEAVERAEVFKRYQLNSEVVDMASDEVVVMHCLPAHRGEEITPEVLDGPRSIVWDQAENRLHAQKALLSHLIA